MEGLSITRTAVTKLCSRAPQLRGRAYVSGTESVSLKAVTKTIPGSSTSVFQIQSAQTIQGKFHMLTIVVGGGGGVVPCFI